MIKVLQTLGLQGTYLKMITIYSTPTVNIVLSGKKCETIHTNRMRISTLSNPIQYLLEDLARIKTKEAVK